MKSFKFGVIAILFGAAALVWGTTAPKTADARPQYRENFAAKYPGLAVQVEKMKCGVCHPPAAEEKKKVRNNYGQALQKALNAKNVTDKEVILKALSGIESGKSATEGKTFGDLIKAGSLPGKNE